MTNPTTTVDSPYLELQLNPLESGTHAVGTVVTLTATLTEYINQPVVGQPITFYHFRGQHHHLWTPVTMRAGRPNFAIYSRTAAPEDNVTALA